MKRVEQLALQLSGQEHSPSLGPELMADKLLENDQQQILPDLEAITSKQAHLKNKMLWELIGQKKYQENILSKASAENIQLGPVSINYLDLSHHEDYKFITHITKTDADSLKATRLSKAEFLRQEAYVSASLIDKDTSPAYYMHRSDSFPALFLILKVPAKNIHITSPMDYFSETLRGPGNHEKKTAALKKYKNSRNAANRLYMHHNATSKDNPAPLLHTYANFSDFKKNIGYEKLDRFNCGDYPKLIPFLPPTTLLKNSHTNTNSNEILIGRGEAEASGIEVVGLGFEKSQMDNFLKNIYPSLEPGKKEAAQQTFKEMALFPRIIRLDTRLEAYKEKPSLYRDAVFKLKKLLVDYSSQIEHQEYYENDPKALAELKKKYEDIEKEIKGLEDLANTHAPRPQKPPRSKL